ncbi:MAG: WD40/YVTN/BNR-like repeat-containing protein, partial [Chitinophagales bacterium]
NDAGSHWTPLNDEMSTLSISSLAQDYFKNQIIYAGTGEGWGNADGIVGNGVYRSEDDGATFTQLPSTNSTDFDYIFKVTTSPVDSNSLYIATGSGKLFRSFNNGDSLKLIFKSGNAISDIKITPTGGVWIAVYYSGMYYSASGDSGTFTAMNNGLATSNMRRIQFDIAQSDTTVLYAAVERSTADGFAGIYKSTDYGQSWVAVVNPTDVGFYTSFTWYSMCIAIKPDDPDFVILGVGDLMYTRNGGGQWFACSNIHADHHVILFHPENPTVFYEGNDGGIYRYSTDTLYLPHNLNDGYRTIQYYAGCFYPAGVNMCAGSQDNGTDKCKAGDASFFFIYGGDGAYCAVNQQYTDVIYASSQNGNIARSFDGTNDVPSFEGIMNELDANGDGTIDEGAWFINPFAINLVNGDYLAFITKERLWESFDGGASWQPAMNQIGGI